MQFLRTHVVSGETPLLIGRRSMEGMRMRIDAANDTVTVDLGAGNFRIRCDFSSSGHLVLSLLGFVASCVVVTSFSAGCTLVFDVRC